MEEQYKRGFENAGKFIHIICELIVVTAGIIFNLFLLFGAMASLFLVYMIFPEEFLYGVSLFMPIWSGLWFCLRFLFYGLMGGLIGYSILRLYFLIDDNIKQKQKQRREEFIKDVAKIINNKQNKKK